MCVSLTQGSLGEQGDCRLVLRRLILSLFSLLYNIFECEKSPNGNKSRHEIDIGFECWLIF